ncbi:MAG: sulfatase [Candidatus Hydrogenedentes bacterium]|nr:sulfatase [Candidatus Hydrogenedentota bacterium]
MYLVLCSFLFPSFFYFQVPFYNLLLLSVDTLRADYLGCYGFPYPISPNIDFLAERGVVFDNCITEIPLTCPSFSAMLTSNYPRSLGVTRNGLGINRKIKTVPEIFKENGYFTFCVQSNWTLKARLSGLSKGFDIYDDDFHSKRWGLFSSERLADEVTARALEILKGRPQDRPFFGWVHYSDPHAPYTYRKGFDVIPPANDKGRKSKKDRVKRNYASEVRFVDEHIGILLKELPPNTKIVFISDHGESLYEHSYLGHGRKLYQNEVKIPLIIVADDVFPGRLNLPVRGIDIGPTILGLVGIPIPKSFLGVDIFRKEISPHRVRVIETYSGAVPKIPILRFFMKRALPIMQAVLVDEWKLILDGNRCELYNLADDPKELKDLSLEQPTMVDKMVSLIKDWDKKTPFRKNIKEDTLSEEDFEILRSMGYLE